ncbi:MAG TPA: CGNR zinc finger domain-containing protein [Natronosporangium sp.]
MSTSAAAPGRLELVRRFVNTVDIEAGEDQLASVAGFADWLREAGLLEAVPAVTDTDRRSVIAVREALRDLLRANHDGNSVPPDSVRILDDAARSLAISFPATGGWRLAPREGGVAGAVGRLLAAVVEAMAEGTWHRLKVCANDACAWAFYDRSRARSGRWCSMSVCGNRAKQRAWRTRRPADRSTST